MKLIKFENNVAHSMGRFGLRIEELAARVTPCNPYRDDKLADPWELNPSFISIFSNFTSYKNSECGILAERLGNARFTDLRLADNKKCGIQSDKTNLTREDVVFEHALIIGKSAFAAEIPLAFFKNARGVIAPKTDRVLFQYIDFHDFYPGMTPLQSCADCFIIYRWI